VCSHFPVSHSLSLSLSFLQLSETLLPVLCFLHHVWSQLQVQRLSQYNTQRPPHSTRSQFHSRTQSLGIFKVCRRTNAASLETTSSSSAGSTRRGRLQVPTLALSQKVLRMLSAFLLLRRQLPMHGLSEYTRQEIIRPRRSHGHHGRRRHDATAGRYSQETKTRIGFSLVGRRRSPCFPRESQSLSGCRSAVPLSVSSSLSARVSAAARIASALLPDASVSAPHDAGISAPHDASVSVRRNGPHHGTPQKLVLSQNLQQMRQNTGRSW
jgi:hypothetical protein